MSKKPAKGEYIETDTGNKVSRRSQLIGTTNIILGGKSVVSAEVIIRGDLVRYPASAPGEKQTPQVTVATGRYCILSKGCELRPPGKLNKGQFTHFPLKLHDHVYVGPGSLVEAAYVGSHIHIGANVIVGKFVMMRDYIRILDDSVVPPYMNIPAFSIVAGRPARIVGEISEGEMEGFDLRDMYRSVH